MLQRGEISVKITAKTDVFFSVCESHSICHCSQIKDWCFPPPFTITFSCEWQKKTKYLMGLHLSARALKKSSKPQ